MSDKINCIVVKTINDLDSLVHGFNFAKQYKIKYAIILDYEDCKIKKYHEVLICSIEKINIILKSIDCIIISDGIPETENDKIKKISKTILNTNIKLKDLRNNKQNEKIYEEFLNLPKEYSIIKTPCFLISGLIENTNKTQFVYELSKYLNTYNENPCVISANEFASMFGFVKFPTTELNKIFDIDEKYIFLNYFLKRIIEIYKCTIILICIPGSYSNPISPLNKKSEALVKLIELAIDVDYHMHLVPVNYNDQYLLKNLIDYINSKNTTKIDAVIFSNIYLDMSKPVIDLKDIEKVIVSEKQNFFIYDSKLSFSTFTVFDKNTYKLLISNIIKKLAIDSNEYRILQ